MRCNDCGRRIPPETVWLCDECFNRLMRQAQKASGFAPLTPEEAEAAYEAAEPGRAP